MKAVSLELELQRATKQCRALFDLITIGHDIAQMIDQDDSEKLDFMTLALAEISNKHHDAVNKQRSIAEKLNAEEFLGGN